MIEAISKASFSAGIGEVRQSAAMAQPASGEADFGSMLREIAANAIGTLRQGEAAAAAGIIGAMPVQQVVDKVLAAERTLQTAVALRDKMVGAYLEITRMQI
jgi:flagellar hook-basal body complex protein FliE